METVAVAVPGRFENPTSLLLSSWSRGDLGAFSCAAFAHFQTSEQGMQVERPPHVIQMICTSMRATKACTVSSTAQTGIIGDWDPRALFSRRPHCLSPPFDLTTSSTLLRLSTSPIHNDIVHSDPSPAQISSSLPDPSKCPVA